MASLAELAQAVDASRVAAAQARVANPVPLPGVEGIRQVSDKCQEAIDQAIVNYELDSTKSKEEMSFEKLRFELTFMELALSQYIERMVKNDLKEETVENICEQFRMADDTKHMEVLSEIYTVYSSRHLLATTEAIYRGLQANFVTSPRPCFQHSFIRLGCLSALNYAMAGIAASDLEQPAALRHLLISLNVLSSKLELHRNAVATFNNASIVASLIKCVQPRKWQMYQTMVRSTLALFIQYSRTQQLMLQLGKIPIICSSLTEQDGGNSTPSLRIVLALARGGDRAVCQELMACNVPQLPVCSVVLRDKCQAVCWEECCNRIAAHRPKIPQAATLSSSGPSLDPPVVNSSGQEVVLTPTDGDKAAGVSSRLAQTLDGSVVTEQGSIDVTEEKSASSAAANTGNRQGVDELSLRDQHEVYATKVKAEVESFLSTVTGAHNRTFRSCMDATEMKIPDRQDQAVSTSFAVLETSQDAVSYACSAFLPCRLASLALWYTEFGDLNEKSSPMFAYSKRNDYTFMKRKLLTFVSSSNSDLAAAAKDVVRTHSLGPPPLLQDLCLQVISENFMLPSIRDWVHFLPTILLRQIVPMVTFPK